MQDSLVESRRPLDFIERGIVRPRDSVPTKALELTAMALVTGGSVIWRALAGPHSQMYYIRGK